MRSVRKIGPTMMTPNPAALSEADYISIEEALLATEKGRAFLQAYVERNRAADTHNLLRSISRLHRATVGEPSFAVGVHRDLLGVMRHVAEVRELTPRGPLLDRLQHVEASLMALTEFVEDRGCELVTNQRPYSTPKIDAIDRHAKLVGELSSLFANEARFGPTEAY